MEEYKDVDTIVLATVGGVDEKQLRLIARRAARLFPEAHHFVLTLGRQSPSEQSERQEEDAQSRMHTVIAPIIAALECSPRRNGQSADERESKEQSRIAETTT
jgi:hypothetical protein